MGLTRTEIEIKNRPNLVRGRAVSQAVKASRLSRQGLFFYLSAQSPLELGKADLAICKLARRLENGLRILQCLNALRRHNDCAFWYGGQRCFKRCNEKLL